MQTRKQDPDAIAEEAVGQRHADPPPYAVKEQPEVSQEEMARRLSKPAGPRASIPEKSAEAAAARNLPGKLAHPAGPDERAGALRHVLDEQPFLMVAASFVLGYMAALMLHGRR